jgi:cytochrome c peroxidase
LGEEGDAVEYWGLILNRLANQAGRKLIKRPAEGFSEDAFHGWMMFVRSYGNDTEIGNCAVCHRTPSFTDGQEHDIGTGGPVVTPSLRDIADKESFFHDERASTLEEVITTHVDNGVIARQFKRRGVDPELGKISLTEEEIAQVAAFVRSLRSVDAESFREYLIDVVVQPLEFEY